MPSTPFLKCIPQRHKSDCAVACLAMLVNVSYEEALLALGTRRVIKAGVTVGQVLRAATRLGHSLALRRRTVDLENDTGILGVRSVHWDFEHLVVLKEGIVVDTDSTIWDADMFLSAYGAQVVSLLVLEDK